MTRTFLVILSFVFLFESTGVGITSSVNHSGKDGTYKAVDYNGKAKWTAVFTIQDGRVVSGKLSSFCPEVCYNVDYYETCYVDSFARKKPLTETSISCGSWRHLTGNLYDTLKSDGGSKNAGAANLKFLTGRSLELFEAEVKKPGNTNLTTRTFAPFIRKILAAEEAETKRLAEDKKLQYLANEMPYWAGHKADLSTVTRGTRSRFCNLNIKYSEDGKRYSATVQIPQSLKASGGGSCEGSVDLFGNLERIECTPGMWKRRDINGTVTKPTLDKPGSGASSTCEWTDKELLVKYEVLEAEEKKRQGLEKTVAENKKLEERGKQAAEETKRRDLIKKEAEKKRQDLAKKAAEDKKRQELARKVSTEKKRKAEEKQIVNKTKLTDGGRELKNQLSVLKQLHSDGLIDEQELKTKKETLLSRYLGLKPTPPSKEGSADKFQKNILNRVLEKYKDLNFGKYHALVIGSNNYKYLPKLTTAETDAKSVTKTLKTKYDFKVKTLIDATRQDILDSLDEYRERLTSSDNLLIYYAGHGYLDGKDNRGYWMPVNARPNRRSAWLANADITGALKALKAKHVMVVSDSCYSGTLTRGLSIKKRTPDYVREAVSKRARVVITSGGLEPVADKSGGANSPFAAVFLKVLNSNDGVLDGTQMFSKMRRPVMLKSEQTPSYADVRKAGHEGGDFLFVRRR